MSTQGYLRRLLAYDQWANGEVMSFIERAVPPPSKSVRWLAHIVAAENLWLDRIEGRALRVVVWPDNNPEAVKRELQALKSRWHSFVADLSDSALLSSVEYKNSKGEPWNSTVEDILIHMAMHSAHHRGQIAADFRAQALEPPYIDYIHAVRQGFLK